MISILVDEAYAFDFLAILQIKSDLDFENKIKKFNFMKCYDHLKSQIGEKLFSAIFHSLEYKECYDANFETFKAVDLAKTDAVPASYVDNCNYKRHLAKQKIQKKFFNEDLSEVKIGYEQYMEK